MRSMGAGRWKEEREPERRESKRIGKGKGGEG